MAKYPRWVYAIFPHDENGNTVGVYVGSSFNPQERIRSHKVDHKTEPPLQQQLHKLMRENGFHYYILGEIRTHDDRSLEYEVIRMFMDIPLKVFNTRTDSYRDPA